ncbi:MAG: class 1 isoprenoid biosynthesis enzyme [Rubrobacteraceae bacterium]|nr:class 1 isoprenoid biosynthesis enzyme [Rubrobacteraceae bacterium]
MYELAVAAKFEYARNRWLDEVADHPDSVRGLSSTHRVNDALLDLICSRYGRVLDGVAAADFFRVLANLYARHALSMTLDSTWYRKPASSITLEEYAEHARMRHGPVRAAVDAVLLSVGAADDLLERARASWHNCALGIQFYDDALDIEEDLLNRNLSWTVTRTFEYFDGHSGNSNTQSMPDPDAFYEVALTKGVICETLSQAESFFAESARLAEPTFPSWVTYQQACVSQTRLLREDYEKLITDA